MDFGVRVVADKNRWDVARDASGSSKLHSHSIFSGDGHGFVSQ
jgi:hypothetical protein